MPRVHTSTWPADELADALRIAADRTLSWEEVAAALHARDPEHRRRRQGPAVRVYLSRHSPVDLTRTTDTGEPYRSDLQPAPSVDLMERALAAARAEGKRAILDDLRAVLARHTGPALKTSKES